MSRKSTSFPLKKQNSCIESNKGGSKITLQKQFSIDIPNSSRSNDKSQHLNNNQLVLSDCTENNLKSLSIFGIKNQTDRTTAAKFEVRNRDRQKNITYRRDERVNLNIFLNHNIKSNPDAVNESESEKEAYSQNFKQECIQCTDVDSTYDERTDARQTQFQAKPLQPLKTTRRPLIRAKSAPVRSNDESTKPQFQCKRRNKQKKPVKVYQESRDEQFFENDDLVNTSARKPKCHNKQLNIPVAKARSVFGCDVITLVSLFSSSESESELEEYVSPRKTDCVTITQPQLLRRCGKSVSFQENDLKVIASTATEFPPMFRRGSIAPLARMFRDNNKRPPTAPPASIYLKNESRVTDEMENTVKPIPIQKKKSEETDVAEDYPDHCNTQKERDCWKLFKKMLGNGVTVNYDTILRGMLTPTELRTVMVKRVQLSQENEENENLPG